MPMTRAAAAILCVMLAAEAAEARPPARSKTSRPMRVTATAYCDRGVTESGARTRRGTIAADPRVLPLGSVVRLTSPLRAYSGTYTVTDTGSKVIGRKVDIFVPSCARARAFGTRVVVIRILRRASASPGRGAAR
jgi:3D (Asp-Asp-Asp) domain-containing protein